VGKGGGTVTGLRKRTRLFVLRGFQIRYISLILLFMFVTVGVTAYMVYMTTWVMFGEKLAAVYPQGLLFDIVNKVNAVLFLRLIFLSPLVILIGLILSHRIAGPIYHIETFIKKILSDDYGHRVTLRENDELQDLAKGLNALVEKLDQGRAGRSTAIDAAISRLDSMGAEDAGRDREAYARNLSGLREEIERLRDIQ
jgi:HAMP domain-containing protein